MSDDRITIETPEHIEIDYELAGLASRAIACMVDSILQGLLVFAFVFVFLTLGDRFDISSFQGFGIAVAIGAVLLSIAYYVFVEMTMNGQSPGKRSAGLRVVRDDGTPITFLDSVIRNTIRLVDMIPFMYSVGLLSVIIHPRYKRLGDMVAGTVVVKERLYELPARLEDPADAPRQPYRIISPEIAARVRSVLPFITHDDFMLVENFLDRRYELDAQARSELALRIASSLLARCPGLDLHDFTEPEAFLETLYQLRPAERF